jgi:tRNA-modifying protein YgfZ
MNSNSRYTILSSLPNEFSWQSDKNYLFDLSYLCALAIAGERAAEFLQGQLSCDVRQVSNDSMQQGAMCNLQGRVLALLDVINWQGLKLILPKDLMAATQTSFSKAAMLSRVKIEPDTSIKMLGFYLANQDDLLPRDLFLPTKPLSLTARHESCCYHLGHQFYVILISKEGAQALSQPFIVKQQMRGSLVWHQLQLRHKAIQIYPETRGLFLPHRLDLHLSGYLSFAKGCYKGQEIVARMHYKAKRKHSLRIFTIATNEPLIVGKKIFDTTGKKEVGELIDYSPLQDERYLIATSILLQHPEEVLFAGHEKAVVLKH